MKVVLPTHLRSYSGGREEVDAEGRTLGEVLASVERRHPGFLIRVVDEQDRIRPHVKCFVDGTQAFALDEPVEDEVFIVAALSGG